MDGWLNNKNNLFVFISLIWTKSKSPYYPTLNYRRSTTQASNTPFWNTQFFKFHSQRIRDLYNWYTMLPSLPPSFSTGVPKHRAAKRLESARWVNPICMDPGICLFTRQNLGPLGLKVEHFKSELHSKKTHSNFRGPAKGIRDYIPRICLPGMLHHPPSLQRHREVSHGRHWKQGDQQ